MTDLMPYIRGEASDKEAETLLSQSFAALDAALKARPHAVQGVLDLLDRRLAQINAETWGILTDSLNNYLGEDLAYPAIWLPVARSDQMDEFEKHASPRIIDFLRTVQGFHGPELQRAFDVWNWSPDDWKTVFRDVLHDQINARYRVKIRVLKYDGEQAVIECSPDSFLELTTNMLRTLRLVPRDGFVNPMTLKAYFEVVVEVGAFLAPIPEAADPSGKEPAALAQ